MTLPTKLPPSARKSNPAKSVFISYSYDSKEHQEWVGKLADDLERDLGTHVVVDQYDLDYTTDKNRFMEESLVRCDVVLVVSTEGYKRKADSRTRGVGYESQIAVQRHLKTEAFYMCKG